MSRSPQIDVLTMQPLRRLIVVFAVASVILMSGSAQAQTPNEDEQARTHFDSGNLHFDRGSYEEAKLEFEAAFRLSGRRALLYNLFISAERLGQFADAIGYLEDYLEDGCPERDRPTLEARLENLQQRASRETEPTVDPARTRTPTTPTRDDGNMLPAVIAFAVAGAGLITFAVAGGLALKEDSSLSETCSNTCDDEEVSTLATRTLVADIGWITAIAAAAAGTVLALTLGRSSGSESDSRRTTLGSWVLPNGGGVVAQGSF